METVIETEDYTEQVTTMDKDGYYVPGAVVKSKERYV